ncbi:MAG: hypothetical protein LBC59_03625 [Chitinispirillales bacterium]|jgi:hypothetical protein|nr:hypothetical protein [Chitinispirillales bacterium]
MKKLCVCLAAVCVFAGAGFAAGGDPTESGIPTSPLKIWSTGVGGGLLYTLSDEIKDSCGQSFGEVIWLNSFDFTDNFALFADISWYIGESMTNFGLDLGGDFMLSSGRVKPFLGVGVGARYYDLGGTSGGTVGGGALVRLGMALELTNTVEVRVRAPFQFALINDMKDMRVGVEVGVVFFSNLRNIKRMEY